MFNFLGKNKVKKVKKSKIQHQRKSFKKIIKFLLKQKKVVIINESPEPVKDSVMGLKIYDKLS